jgi:hypothetical protein
MRAAASREVAVMFRANFQYMTFVSLARSLVWQLNFNKNKMLGRSHSETRQEAMPSVQHSPPPTVFFFHFASSSMCLRMRSEYKKLLFIPKSTISAKNVTASPARLTLTRLGCCCCCCLGSVKYVDL